MTVEVRVPDIGADEVEITEILVNSGDRIHQEQSLMTVEGDKASMDIPAPCEGVVKEIKVAVGDKVATGKLIMIFEAAESVATATEPVKENKKQDVTAAATATSQEVKVPDIGADEVEVTDVMVKLGDNIAAEQALITVEGDKASMEVPAPFSGTVLDIKVNPGDKVKTGSLIMLFGVQGTQSPDTVAPQTTSASAETTGSRQTEPMTAAPVTRTDSAAPVTDSVNRNEFSENDAYVHATPVIRRMARELGVNLSKVKGSGRKTRILREDLQAYVKEAVKRAESSGASGMAGMLPWPNVDFSKFGEIEEVALGRIQKISGANLSRNWVMIPHVTQFDETDITDVEAFRQQQNREAEKKKLEVKITPLVFLMKAVAQALEEFPHFNSSLSADGVTLTLKKYINIGVAVDTPQGLVVPVFRNINKKGILELSRELAVMSKKAREGKLMAADMQGGCFTISSLGGIGGTMFTPIVNAPEVAILGVSKSAMKPVWNGQEFIPRLMLPLSLSFDHRVIDGAAGARFISHIGKVMADIRHLVM